MAKIKCIRCSRFLPKECFSKDSNQENGLDYYCKSCRSEIRSDWYLRNKERDKNNVRRFRKNNPDYVRQYHKEKRIKDKKYS